MTAKVEFVQVVSVSSLKGGVGKTTITLGLASAAFAQGLRTLIIDMDPQSDVSAALASRSTHGFTIDTVLKAATKKNVRQSIIPSSWTGSGDVEMVFFDFDAFWQISKRFRAFLTNLGWYLTTPTLCPERFFW